MNTTLLIVDDHTLIRETWSFILNMQPGFTVVGECGTGEEAIELARSLRPDVVILDINLPGISGIEAIRQIRKYTPGTRVLGVSLHTQPAYARKMMQEGATGYVTKNSPREEMFQAIREVQQGRKYVCQEIKNILSEQLISSGKGTEGIHSLTSRELEVIARIKRGETSRDIAKALGISAKTVEVHRYRILQKLGQKNTVSLINLISQSRLALVD